MRALLQAIGGVGLGVIGGSIPAGFASCSLDPSCVGFGSNIPFGWAIALLALASILFVAGVSLMVVGMLKLSKL